MADLPTREVSSAIKLVSSESTGLHVRHWRPSAVELEIRVFIVELRGRIFSMSPCLSASGELLPLLCWWPVIYPI